MALGTGPRLPFADRADAGRRLGDRLAAELGPLGDPAGVLVLGLPRGGVVVAAEVARRLGAPLDALVVRKLGVPGQPELALGAVAAGVVVRNEAVIAGRGVAEEAVAEVVARERAELNRRERAYRGDRPPPDAAGRLAIVVDDGFATGATARAALLAVRAQQPAGLVLAVPVAPRYADTGDADRLVALARPWPFGAVGRYYRDFAATTDDEVCRLLGALSTREGPGSPGPSPAAATRGASPPPRKPAPAPAGCSAAGRRPSRTARPGRRPRSPARRRGTR